MRWWGRVFGSWRWRVFVGARFDLRVQYRRARLTSTEIQRIETKVPAALFGTGCVRYYTMLAEHVLRFVEKPRHKFHGMYEPQLVARLVVSLQL